MRLVIYIFLALMWSIASNAQIPTHNSTNTLAGEWEAILDGDYEYNIERLGGCELAEKRLKLAMASGYDANKAWMMIGMCRYEFAEKVKFKPSFETCGQLHKSGRHKMPYFQKWENTMQAFEAIESSSSHYDKAQLYLEFSKSMMKVPARNCELPHHFDLCFWQIRDHYDQIDRGDKSELHWRCEPYKSDYDARFRKTK